MMAVLPREWNAKQLPRVERIKRLAINAFLLFHLAAITCWCIPLSSPLITNFRDIVRPYLLWSGLFQGWDMFAPSPKTTNSYLEAVVIFKDGRTQTWKFPRMEHLGFADRYYQERYRKFAESVQNDDNSVLWPDVARHIARLHNLRLHNDASAPPAIVLPAIVLLVRYWSEISPPAPSGLYHPEPWHANIFFEYNVKPQDLK